MFGHFAHAQRSGRLGRRTWRRLRVAPRRCICIGGGAELVRWREAPHTVPARRPCRDQGDRREPSGRTRGSGRPAAWLATAGPHGLARMRDAATLGRVRLQGAIVALGYENGVLLVLVSTCRGLAHARAYAARLQPELKVPPSVSLGVRMCSAVRRSGSNKLTTPKYTPSCTRTTRCPRMRPTSRYSPECSRSFVSRQLTTPVCVCLCRMQTR